MFVPLGQSNPVRFTNVIIPPGACGGPGAKFPFDKRRLLL